MADAPKGYAFDKFWVNRIKEAVRRVERMPRNDITQWPRVPRSPGTTTTTGGSDIVFGVVVHPDGIPAALSDVYDSYSGPGLGTGDSGWMIQPGRQLDGVELYDYFETGTHYGSDLGTLGGGADALDRYGSGVLVNAANYDPVAVFYYGTPVYLLHMGDISGAAWYEIISGACASLDD